MSTRGEDNSHELAVLLYEKEKKHSVVARQQMSSTRDGPSAAVSMEVDLPSDTSHEYARAALNAIRTYVDRIPLADSRDTLSTVLDRYDTEVDALLSPKRIAVFGSSGSGKSTLMNAVGANGIRLLPGQTGGTSRSMVITEIGCHNEAHDNYIVYVHVKSRDRWQEYQDKSIIALFEPDETDVAEDVKESDHDRRQRLVQWLHQGRSNKAGNQLKANHSRFNQHPSFRALPVVPSTVDEALHSLNDMYDHAILITAITSVRQQRRVSWRHG